MTNLILERFRQLESLLNERGRFGSEPYPNPTKTWMKLINTAYQDGVLSDMSFNDPYVTGLAKNIGDEMEELVKEGQTIRITKYLRKFYHNIPFDLWDKGRIETSTKIEYGLTGF